MHLPSRPSPSSARNSRSGAFTLVEVTIALGICATVLMTLLALLPTSLETMRQAAAMATEARIAESIVGEAQLTDWQEMIENMDGAVLYFDAEGGNITGTLEANRNRLLYAAKIILSEEGVTVPGSDAPNEFTRRLTIHIAETRDANFDFINIEGNRKVHTYSATLARLTQQDTP
ncbi:MAG TPA: Verru_Chthon cassette protein B [Verrucomicrobiales bacterium]|nr:Verru_Chthon cassette protein B [Verrucomicrobiales bacterium]